MKRKKICACILMCALCTGNILPAFAAEVPEAADIPDATGIEEFIEETEINEDENPETTEEDTEKESCTKTETAESSEAMTEIEAPLEESLFSDGESPADFSSEDGGNASLFSAGDEEETGTEGLVYEYIEETDSYMVVKGVDVESVHIPATYEGKPVTEIAAGAFVDFEVMQSISVEQPGFLIHTGAFHNCSSLSSVIALRWSIRIESQAFTECNKLAYVGQLEGIENIFIASDAFDPDSKVIVYCSGWYPENPENSFVMIDPESYYELRKDGVIYQGLEWLGGDDAFMAIVDFDNSRSLLNLRYAPEEARLIYRKAFYGCDKLEEVFVSPETNYVQTKAFAYCVNLQNIHIPASVTEIADDAFLGCEKLTITGAPGSYAEQYANAHGIPFQAELSAPIITNVTVNKNMVTVELGDFYGDMFYCVAGTDHEYGVPIRGKDGRIATYQKGNKVIFRNLNGGSYYIGTRALSVDGNKKTYSEWSNLAYVSIEVDTPSRPNISSASVSGRNIQFIAALPKGISGYDIMLSRGTKKNDSSTAGVAIPASNRAVYGRSKPASGTKETVTIRNIKPGTYYLGIQAYSVQEGKKVYSQWSPLKKIRIQ